MKHLQNELSKQANEIRKLPRNEFSYEKKSEIISVLKDTYEYVKDTGTKSKALAQHHKKQDVLIGITSEGIPLHHIEKVKEAIYPEHKVAQEQLKAKYIQEAITHNAHRHIYMESHNNDKDILEVFSKIKYQRENLGNGRKIHILNGKKISFPKDKEFEKVDMMENGKFTMDAVTNTQKYKQFQEETGMSKVSVGKIYNILGDLAQAMGITSTIDYDFFKNRSEDSKALLQMFGNITGFQGSIPINIINDGNNAEYISVNWSTGFYADNHRDPNSFLAG